MKDVLLTAALILGFVALAVGALTLASFTILWNTQDIITNGLNFWNVFWLTLTGVALFGTTGAASK